MNTSFSRQVPFLLGIAAIAAVSNGLPAQAEMPKADAPQLAATTPTVEAAKPVLNTIAVQPLSVDTAKTALSQETTFQLTTDSTTAPQAAAPNSLPVPGTTVPTASAPVTAPQAVATISQPVPGTTVTTAAALMKQPTGDALFVPSEKLALAPAEYRIAQTEFIPGRATRYGTNYIGVAGNIGIGGNSALGRGNFALISKLAFAESFSVRPAVVFGDQTILLVPVTYDFAVQQTDPFEPIPYAPYVGAGLSLATGGGSSIGLLLSGGVDLPLTKQFTATAGLNVSLRNNTDVGLLVGIGYNFMGF
jgi:hypothetical protein